MSLDKQLAPFLRNLADLIDNDKMSIEDLQKVGEFFMTYNMLTNTSLSDDNENDENEENDISDIDMMKFVALGWFIYKNILNNQSEKPP